MKRRWAVPVVLVAVALGLAGLVAYVRGGGAPSSEGAILGGAATCRAVFPDVLRPGHETGVVLEVTNTGDDPIRIRAVGTVEVRDAEGHVLTDSIRGVGLGTGEVTVGAGGSETLPPRTSRSCGPGP